MGRPRIPAERRKKFCRSTYFYHDEFYQVAREAVRAGMHVSEFIRRAVIEKMEKEKCP